MGGFRAKLEVLEKIGKENLPEGEENLWQARGFLVDCDSESDAAFGGAEGADLYSDVAKAFTKVSDDLYASLMRNCELLGLASEAIQEIVKRYAQLDGQEP